MKAQIIVTFESGNSHACTVERDYATQVNAFTGLISEAFEDPELTKLDATPIKELEIQLLNDTGIHRNEVMMYSFVVGTSGFTCLLHEGDPPTHPTSYIMHIQSDDMEAVRKHVNMGADELTASYEERRKKINPATMFVRGYFKESDGTNKARAVGHFFQPKAAAEVLESMLKSEDFTLSDCGVSCSGTYSVMAAFTDEMVHSTEDWKTKFVEVANGLLSFTDVTSKEFAEKGAHFVSLTELQAKRTIQ